MQPEVCSMAKNTTTMILTQDIVRDVDAWRKLYPFEITRTAAIKHMVREFLRGGRCD